MRDFYLARKYCPVVKSHSLRGCKSIIVLVVKADLRIRVEVSPSVLYAGEAKNLKTVQRKTILFLLLWYRVQVLGLGACKGLIMYSTNIIPRIPAI